MSRKTIDELLEEERATYRRVTAREASQEVARGGLIIDIRPTEQRRSFGVVPGAADISRNVLEWRIDPDLGWMDERVAACQGRLIIMCQEGYQSSLAAATLQRIGIDRATDLVGGFEAWADQGLPVEPLAEDPSQ